MEELGPLLAAIRRAFPASRFTRLEKPELDLLRHQYPSLPSHYLAFLRDVGWGSLGESNFMVYSGLCQPAEFFDPETAARLDGILFFGDNFADRMVGFDTRNGWRIVGVDSASPEPDPEDARTIGELIAERIEDREYSQ
jgi:hypothetical protein